MEHDFSFVVDYYKNSHRVVISEFGQGNAKEYDKIFTTGDIGTACKDYAIELTERSANGN